MIPQKINQVQPSVLLAIAIEELFLTDYTGTSYIGIIDLLHKQILRYFQKTKILDRCRKGAKKEIYMKKKLQDSNSKSR